MKWDRRRYGFPLFLPLLADCLPSFPCVCLFRLPPSPDGSCVTSNVPTASLQCQPNLNGGHVNPGVTMDSKLRKCLSSGEAGLCSDQDIVSIPSYNSVVSYI